MKYRVLLVNPWITDFTAYDLWIKPIGLLYIASILKKWDVAEICFIDCLDTNHPQIPEKYRRKKENGTSKFFSSEIEKPEILKDVPKKFKIFGKPIEIFEDELEKTGKIDAVFITSFMTYWYPGVQLAVEKIREKYGSVPIILGGIYPTLMPEHAKKESGADVIVEGEGENQIGKILNEVLAVKRDFENFENIDSYPYPDFSIISNRQSLPFLTSRGCPFRCTYCASSIVSGKFRERSVEKCIEELVYIKDNFGTKNIAFYDDALLINPEKRIKPLMRKIIENSFNFHFHTPNGLWIKEIDEEIAMLMKKCNFKTIRLSLEGTNSEFFRKTNSEHKTANLKETVSFFEKAGYRKSEIEVYILIGLPYQEFEEVSDSLNYAKECGVKVRFSYFSPIPKTIEWKNMVKEGLIKENSDPLLHNKILFPYLWSKITPEKLGLLKNIQREINSSLSSK